MFVFETWNLLEYNLNGISWKIVSLLYYIMESERKIFQIYYLSYLWFNEFYFNI